MESLYQSFIPLFVAIDALGIMPIFISLTNGMTLVDKRKLAIQSTLTAIIICLVILGAGRVIFDILSINVDDLKIGGGLILLVLAIYDLLFSTEERKNADVTTVGIVPIGIPLIAGPTAITTLLVSSDTYGMLPTLASLIANMVIVFVVFYYSDFVTRVMGQSASRAFAKIMNLFLAAIAVHMITSGITNIVKQAFAV